MSGIERTVRGAAVTAYTHPDGSYRFARLGDVIEVAESDVERFDRLEGLEPSSGYVEDSLPVAPGTEPARAGRGSSRQAWADFAVGRGFTVTDDMGRDDIIALIDGPTTEPVEPVVEEPRDDGQPV
jgi:hypothetical protein